MSRERPFTVALTGGIGSGKSTVAQGFVDLGAALVDTDDLARQLTAPGGAALPALCAAFGAEISAADGGLDRPLMRQKVFANAAIRRQLEAILHPLIHARVQSALAALAYTAPYALVAIPLLVESGGRQRYAPDRVLVVDCPENLQIQRVMARSALGETEANAILLAQASRKERLAVADDIIDNSGSPKALLPRISRLHASYLHMRRICP
ncbi:MAG: dephospho-CoA kinase [Zoogloeaceae bacterium]|jgi:dephospho-CoA kinase|nr:dephospho-CoA kinase [Zoogloeaceae bacterium]